MFGAALEPGDVFHHRMPGGGGWGDPLERDPEAVAEDVCDDKISRAAAREHVRRRRRRRRRRRPRRDGGAPRDAPPPRHGGRAMKVARVEATPLAIPLEQEFHWSGRRAARREPRPLLRAHRRRRRRLRRVDLRGPCRGRLLRAPDGAALRRARARERRGDAARRLDAGPLALLAAVHAADGVGDRGRLLGRARPHARRPHQHLLRRPRPRRGRLLRLRPGRHAPTQLGRHAGQLAALGHEVLYVKIGRGARDDEACVAADPRRDRARPPAARRPERGVGRRRGDRADPAARAVRDSTGSSNRCRRAT